MIDVARPKYRGLFDWCTAVDGAARIVLSLEKEQMIQPQKITMAFVYTVSPCDISRIMESAMQ